jgi:hypothetical protein
VSFTKVVRTVAAAVALTATAVVLTAGTASAGTGDIQGTGGPESAASDATPAGVPVVGTVQAAAGATKALPSGGGSQGSGY